MLYTDLANPTSNAIYQAMGYRRIGDSISIFDAYVSAHDAAGPQRRADHRPLQRQPGNGRREIALPLGSVRVAVEPTLRRDPSS